MSYVLEAVAPYASATLSPPAVVIPNLELNFAAHSLPAMLTVDL